ncbi:Exopolyphosphatase [Arthrobotrys entomopaga]|nr:Exopolyphosphatase [Arthrobotrys entomopaga]
MKVIRIATAISFALSCRLAASLNIIINNDDGWAAANIREFYKALRAGGHNAFIVAPVEQQSGMGGRTVFSGEATLSRPGQFDTVPAGAPSFGSDPMDSHIWYYNGTPAAVTFFALDYLVKTKSIFNGADPDLVVTGPNEESNVGPFIFTLSGTLGAAYAAVGRGIPAVAFSATIPLHRDYRSVNETDDPATITAGLAVKVVDQLAKNGVGKNNRLLPYGYGLNVNFPYIAAEASLLSQVCTAPPFVHARITGGAATNFAVYNNVTGLFTYAPNLNSPGVNACINGDCGLPGESDVIKDCKSSISVFTIDFDAPNCGGATQVRALLDDLVEAPTSAGAALKFGVNTGLIVLAGAFAVGVGML